MTVIPFSLSFSLLSPPSSSSFLLLQTFWHPRTLTGRKRQKCPNPDCWRSPWGPSGDSNHWLIPENKTTWVQWSLCSTKARSPQKRFWVRNKGDWKEGSTLPTTVLGWPSSLFSFFEEWTLISYTTDYYLLSKTVMLSPETMIPASILVSVVAIYMTSGKSLKEKTKTPSVYWCMLVQKKKTKIKCMEILCGGRGGDFK